MAANRHRALERATSILSRALPRLDPDPVHHGRDQSEAESRGYTERVGAQVPNHWAATRGSSYMTAPLFVEPTESASLFRFQRRAALPVIAKPLILTVVFGLASHYNGFTINASPPDATRLRNSACIAE